MRCTLVVAALLPLAFLAAPARAFDPAKCAPRPCVECHKLTLDEASQLLKGVVDRVTAVGDGELKGFWKLDVEGGGRKGSVYLDYSKRYLTGSPRILRVETSKIPLGDAIVVGKADAPVKIVVFDDPECPYCQKLQAEMKKVVETRPDVAFHIKMFPLAIHPKAKDKAKAIVCEKSLQLLDDSLAGKEIPAPKCETSVIEENIRLAQELGISSTPTLVLPDGKVRPGYMPADKILEMLPQPRSGQK